MFKFVTAAVLLVAFNSAQSASFTPLGILGYRGAQHYSYATAVSADGLVVVGTTTNAGRDEPFMWTVGGGMVGLGGFAGSTMAGAYGVSADGSTVVGYSNGSGFGPRAFRWTSAHGMQALGTASSGSPASRYAFATSADGSIVTGRGFSSSGDEAFLWDIGSGVTGLGILPGENSTSYAFGISGDGSVIVGRSGPDQGNQAVSWTGGGVINGLGYLPGDNFSGAYGISADGSVVVGNSAPVRGDISRAFRWTSASGMESLPGECYSSVAFGASADGSVIVGRCNTGTAWTSLEQAVIWTASGGMQRLFDVLAANGATGLTGWNLGSIDQVAVSPDGKWIVGTGLNPLGEKEAYLANISIVPIPAAAWLFGGALGLLGMVRRTSVRTN